VAVRAFGARPETTNKETEMRGLFEVAAPRRLGRHIVSVAGFVAVLAIAFAAGAQLTVATSHAAVRDSCTPADTNANSTVITKDEHIYNCHPSLGNSLPTGGVIGWQLQGSNPSITGHWWNTVAVDGDAGSLCQPSTKWLRGSSFNWWSATCTQAP
jgi:hypothetical protein